MDETGVQEGLVLENSRKVAAVKKKKVAGGRCWNSIIEFVSAVGVALSSALIFKGKEPQRQWLPLDLRGLEWWLLTASEKGWTNDAIALRWLNEVLLPQTNPKKPQHRLLIVDAHGSHTSGNFLYTCYLKDVYLVFLPPHACHVL